MRHGKSKWRIKKYSMMTIWGGMRIKQFLIMSAKFQIEKVSGQFTQQSRDLLKEQFSTLPDGKHDVLITPAKGYSPSRYKHYFDSVLWQILNEAGRLPDCQPEHRRATHTARHNRTTRMYEGDLQPGRADGRKQNAGNRRNDNRPKQQGVYRGISGINHCRSFRPTLQYPVYRLQRLKDSTGQTPGSILKTLTKNECNRNKTKTN